MVLNRNLLWNYIGYGITFLVNVLLLPIVLHFLTIEEMGLWYVFMNIGVLVAMVDFGFSPQLARFVTYAYAGADVLVKEGISSGYQGKPNLNLLYKLLRVSRIIYCFLALFVLVLMLTIGSYYVYSISSIFPIYNTFVAWFIFCIATFINILYCYYATFYRGIGDFVTINKAVLASKLLQIFISFIGLYYGGGLIAVSIAYLLSGIIFRVILGLKIKTFVLYNPIQIKPKFDMQILKSIWHNSWREGMVTLSRFLVLQSNTILCSLYIGLSDTASYALAVQLFTIISSISLIYFTTNSPRLNTLRVTNQLEDRKTLLSKLWVSYIGSYLLLVGLLYLFGIPILEYIKQGIMLDRNLLLVVTLFMFLESNHSLFASYISTSNKIPYLKSYLLSSICGVLLSILFLEYTNLGIWGIILAHLFIQLIYNDWKWPSEVLREFKISIKDMFLIGIDYYFKRDRV